MLLMGWNRKKGKIYSDIMFLGKGVGGIVDVKF